MIENMTTMTDAQLFSIAFFALIGGTVLIDIFIDSIFKGGKR